jgi:hypothetical protein
MEMFGEADRLHLLVTALMAMRGIDLISATTFLAEIGDLSRFRTARELMAYLGLVPSEESTGDTVKRGSITKTGNRRARHILVECAWSYRHPPRVGRKKQEKVAAAPRAVREIAWKAQCRLSARYRALSPGRASSATSPSPRSHVSCRLHLGHQSRGDHGPCRGRIRRDFRRQEVAYSETFSGSRCRGKVRRRQSRATAGAEPRQGNSRSCCEADRKIDART